MTAPKDSGSIKFPPIDRFAEPRLQLLQVRLGIEQRLRWLEQTLAPDAAPSDGLPGNALVERGYINSEDFARIAEITHLANRAVHEASLPFTDQILAVEAGTEVINGLDQLVASAEAKLSSLTPIARVLYRFVELPSIERLGIAMKLGLAEQGDGALPKLKLAEKVVRAAKTSGKLPVLWEAIASETPFDIGPYQ